MAQLEGETPEERIAALVTAVGGPVRAAALIGKTRTHVDNMRKAGAPLRLEDVLVLAREAGMAPVIAKGAFLALDARKQPPRTGLYLVAVGDELLPRRLHRLPDGSAELIADADPRWRFVVGNGAAVELYRIVWVGQGA